MIPTPFFPLNRYNCYSTYSLYPYDYYPNSPILRCLPLTVSQNLDIMHIGFALGEGKVNRLLGTLNCNSMIPGVQTDYHSSVPYILRISRTFVLCVYKYSMCLPAHTTVHTTVQTQTVCRVNDVPYSTGQVGRQYSTFY